MVLKHAVTLDISYDDNSESQRVRRTYKSVEDDEILISVDAVTTSRFSQLNRIKLYRK